MEIYVKDNKALSLDGKFLSTAVSGETWVLNETIDTSSTFDYTINFISNNTEYVRIVSSGRLGPGAINHNLVYFNIDGASNTAFAGEFNFWQDQAYRPITFAQPVTDSTLLAWLQANAAKQ